MIFDSIQFQAKSYWLIAVLYYPIPNEFTLKIFINYWIHKNKNYWELFTIKPMELIFVDKPKLSK